METSIELSLRHLATFHASESRPVADSQNAYASEKHLNDTTAKIVGNQQIRVNQVQFVDEHFEHLSLVLEYRNVGVSLLFDFLLEVEWERLLVQFPQQSKTLELFIPGWTILVYFVLHNARDKRNLLGIMLRSGHFGREGQRNQWWTGLIDIVYSADAVFRSRNRYFLLAPSSLNLLCFLDISQSEPARSLDLLLQYEKLKHALLCAKNGLKTIACQIGREGWHRRRVFDFENLMLAMFQRSLEAVLAMDTLALQHSDVFESALTDLFKFSVSIGQKLVLLLLGKCSTGFAAHFRNRVHSTLHAIDPECAGDILVHLWLPHLAEKEEFVTVLLLVSVNPEER